MTEPNPKDRVDNANNRPAVKVDFFLKKSKNK